MLEAYKIAPQQKGLGRKLREFNVGGMKTVIVDPAERIDVVLKNNSPEATSTVVRISVDQNPAKVEFMESFHLRRLPFGTLSSEEKKKYQEPAQHLYDHQCPTCISGQGHVVRVEHLTGEDDRKALRLMTWDAYTRIKGLDDIPSNFDRFDDEQPIREDPFDEPPGVLVA